MKNSRLCIILIAILLTPAMTTHPMGARLAAMGAKFTARGQQFKASIKQNASALSKGTNRVLTFGYPLVQAYSCFSDHFTQKAASDAQLDEKPDDAAPEIQDFANQQTQAIGLNRRVLIKKSSELSGPEHINSGVTPTGAIVLSEKIPQIKIMMTDEDGNRISPAYEASDLFKAYLMHKENNNQAAQQEVKDRLDTYRFTIVDDNNDLMTLLKARQKHIDDNNQAALHEVEEKLDVYRFHFQLAGNKIKNDTSLQQGVCYLLTPFVTHFTPHYGLKCLKALVGLSKQATAAPLLGGASIKAGLVKSAIITQANNFHLRSLAQQADDQIPNLVLKDGKMVPNPALTGGQTWLEAHDQAIDQQLKAQQSDNKLSSYFIKHLGSFPAPQDRKKRLEEREFIAQLQAIQKEEKEQK